MIETRDLTKRFGTKVAVDELSFEVKPGVVTGFLGPNGAGKSTTIRLLLGLDQPTAGTTRVNGRRYTEMRAPLREVGAMLEARAVHTGRSARNHLLALAATSGISTRRVDEVIAMVGLESVAGKRAGGFSLGMGQRLGLASALLGDPQTLLLDEPVNGLDPEGVLWIRNLLKGLAAEGRTVFVSSHLMSEMALTASHLIVIGRGRLIADVTVAEMLNRASNDVVRVRTEHAQRLRSLVSSNHVQTDLVAPHELHVSGLDSASIGRIAAQLAIPLIELTPVHVTLEEAFMELTRHVTDFHTSPTPSTAHVEERV